HRRDHPSPKRQRGRGAVLRWRFRLVSHPHKPEAPAKVQRRPSLTLRARIGSEGVEGVGRVSCISPSRPRRIKHPFYGSNPGPAYPPAPARCQGVALKDIDYAAPKTVAEAVALLTEKGERARVLAGGTDLLVQVREHRRDLDLFVDVKRIPEVNELAYDPRRGLRLGAAVPCYRVYEHAEIARAYPGLIDA